MKFKKVYSSKEYIRKIECMGEGLVLFKILEFPEMIHYYTAGVRYHLLYEDGSKPPFDIALDFYDKEIKYITYFLQDETVENIENIPGIKYEKKRISIRDSEWNADREWNLDTAYITRSRKFRFFRKGNTFFVLRDNLRASTLIAYKLNDLNSMLFWEGDFAGMEYKNLSREELLEIEKSKCIKLSDDM